MRGLKIISLIAHCKKVSYTWLENEHETSFAVIASVRVRYVGGSEKIGLESDLRDRDLGSVDIIHPVFSFCREIR